MQLELAGLAAGLQLIEAPGLGALFEHPGDRLAPEPLPPFERELIVVADNRGLAPWPELRLADRLGCAAGIDILPLKRCEGAQYLGSNRNHVPN